MRADVVIVGGGVAGLTCAVGLVEQGLSVIVLERSSILGGRARSWVDERTGDVVDVGPHILLSEYRNFFRLLDRLGTKGKILWSDEKLFVLVDHGRPIDLRIHALPPPLHMAPTGLHARLSLRDALSNLSISWLAMQTDEDLVLELDGLSAAQLLRQRHVSNKLQRWFWASACMTILNAPMDRCSAGALLRFYAMLIGLNDYRVGLARCGLSQLYAHPAASYIARKGGRVLLETEVARLERTGDRVTGVVLTDGTTITAQACVAAVPPDALAPLVPEAFAAREELGAKLSRFQPSPYISTYLWFDRKLTHERFWNRVYTPSGLNYDSYDLSNIREGWQDRPSVIASNIMYSHRASHLTDDEIVAATLGELAEYLPEIEHARVRHARVHRIPMGVPYAAVGTERLRPPARTAIAGLHLAGDWTRTSLPASMESAARSGWLAAESVAAELAHPVELAIAPRYTEGLPGFVRRFATRIRSRRGVSAGWGALARPTPPLLSPAR